MPDFNRFIIAATCQGSAIWADRNSNDIVSMTGKGMNTAPTLGNAGVWVFEF